MTKTFIQFGYSVGLGEWTSYCASPKAPLFTKGQDRPVAVPSFSLCGIPVKKNSTDKPKHIKPKGRNPCKACAEAWRDTVKMAEDEPHEHVTIQGKKIYWTKHGRTYELAVSVGAISDTVFIRAQNIAVKDDKFKTPAYKDEFDAWEHLVRMAPKRKAMRTPTLFDLGGE